MENILLHVVIMGRQVRSSPIGPAQLGLGLVHFDSQVAAHYGGQIVIVRIDGLLDIHIIIGSRRNFELLFAESQETGSEHGVDNRVGTRDPIPAQNGDVEIEIVPYESAVAKASRAPGGIGETRRAIVRDS
jgi:hypothetical protein